MIGKLFDVGKHARNEIAGRRWIIECDVIGNAVEIGEGRFGPNYFSHRPHALFGFRVGEHSSLVYSALTPRNPLEQCDAPFEGLVSFDIHQIGRRFTVLSDENGLTVSIQLSQQFRGLSFERGHQFRAHNVIL